MLIEEYINDIKKMRPLIAKTLQEAKRYCSNYFTAKEDLAYLSYFRKNVEFDFKALNLQDKNKNNEK